MESLEENTDSGLRLRKKATVMKIITGCLKMKAKEEKKIGCINKSWNLKTNVNKSPGF